MPTTSCLIRDARAEDEARWRDLWAQYIAFYKAQVAEAATAKTWQRILEPNSDVLGRVAEVGGKVVGISNSIIHPITWTEAPICYLEDLFVDPAARGQGVGRALIDDLLVLARERGWSRLYWHTHQENATARRLYDTFSPADGFVRYRLFVD